MKKGHSRTPFPAQKNQNLRPARVFFLKEINRDQTGTKFLNMKYTAPKIYPPDFNLDVPKWHVEFRYINPDTGKRERFKVYEDINRQKGQDKVEYAKLLRDAVNMKLMQGFDPIAARNSVKDMVKGYADKKAALTAADKSHYTILHALNFFIQQKKKQGISQSTMDGYASSVKFFKNWLNGRNMLLQRAADITEQDILTFLSEYADLELTIAEYPPQGKRKWSNRAYNNHLNYVGILFNFLAARPHKIIKENPLFRPVGRETLARKHTAYTDTQLQDILALVRSSGDKYMEGVILTIYYACVRSKSEMRALRAGNVLYERDLIRLDAEGTKGKRDDHIPLDPFLKRHFIEQGYDKLPADYYIFGYRGKPGPVQAGEGYYAEQFKLYRDEIGLSDDYTLYGFKHTRVIHLASAGVSPYELMQLLRHTDLEQLMAYLRNLGVLIKHDTVQKSRQL